MRHSHRGQWISPSHGMPLHRFLRFGDGVQDLNAIVLM